MANTLFSMFRRNRSKEKDRSKMVLLKQGDSGESIRVLQDRLNALGFPCGTADGQYGQRTKIAVEQFQQSNNLRVTGEIDNQTLQALGYEVQPDENRPPAQPQQPSNAPPTGSRPLTAAQVSKMFPGAPLQNIRTYLPLVLDALNEYQLNDGAMLLTALATIRAETGSFAPISEYVSAYNTASGGAQFAKYDFRQDLGNNAAGDGARYRGRGFIQLTGKNNYTTYSRQLGLGDLLLKQPDMANDPQIAARVLAAFLKDKESIIRGALERDDFVTARKAVNGGTHGLDNFIASFKVGRNDLGIG